MLDKYHNHKQARQTCRRRAMVKLARLFPREFERLLAVEMKKEKVMGSPKFRGQATDPPPTRLGPGGRLIWPN